jgi:hypothetical protein
LFSIEGDASALGTSTDKFRNAVRGSEKGKPICHGFRRSGVAIE